MTELETMQRAKMYLDKLARGVDPITDRELPEDTVLNNVRICRCLHYVSGVLDQVIANGGVVGKREGTPFVIDRSRMGRICLTQNPVSLTEFTGNIVAAMDDPNMKRPNARAITGWLTQRGLMELTTDAEGKQRRLPTEAGLRAGLSTARRMGQNGEYLAVYYDANIQRLILDNLEEILGS
jgi:hypothetical protein